MRNVADRIAPAVPGKIGSDCTNIYCRRIVFLLRQEVKNRLMRRNHRIDRMDSPALSPSIRGPRAYQEYATFVVFRKTKRIDIDGWIESMEYYETSVQNCFSIYHQKQHSVSSHTTAWWIPAFLEGVRRENGWNNYLPAGFAVIVPKSRVSLSCLSCAGFIESSKRHIPT